MNRASVFLRFITTAREGLDTGRGNINGRSHNRCADADTRGHNRHGRIRNRYHGTATEEKGGDENQINGTHDLPQLKR